ncbi:polysaccharide biosynthesis/export family protein [Sinimarinibacterium thermocellulolyticum]|uniref:Polysaccharide biosynthesis/export family protein n=1 Tax=Sinimarinibacterium thermocellulolyticum TaxID=3170016 RepID=A0ABV2A6P6_9GAMM
MLAAATSACSILPGMHVTGVGSIDGKDKAVVKNGSVTEYRAQLDNGEWIGYRVVEVSAQSLAQIRQETDAIWPPLPPEFEQITPDQVPPEYRIGPGDVVLIVVWDHPELSAPLGDRSDIVNAGRLVSADGTMFYPYIGEFKVAGMTVGELRAFIAQRISRVITSPQVDARVVAFRSQRVQVTGDVQSPGTVTLDDTPKGVLEAINERGGLGPAASRRRVLLTRGGVSYPLDLAGMLSGDRPVSNPRLIAGDIVHVPDNSNDLVFVLGETTEQKQIVLQQGKTTLTEALAQAGGLDKLRADDAGVLVFRRPFAQGLLPTIYTLDLDHPLGLMLAGELVLHPRDVVYVKATDFAKYNSVIGQLLPTISAVFQIDRLTQ